MQKHPGIRLLTIFLTAGLVLAVVAGSAWVYSSWLPDPEHANHRELMMWLVTRDLKQESVQTREALARRLDSEFDKIDWNELGVDVSEEQRRQLMENMPLVLEPWFMDKLEDYGKLDKDQQPTCVDTVIDRLVELSHIECLQDKRGAQSSPGLEQLLLENVETWKEQAPPEKKQRIGQFILAIQFRWVMRTLSGNMPSKP